METKTRFIIDTNGLFFREDTSLSPIDPGPELEKLFKSTLSVKIPRLMVIPTWGQVSVAVDENAYQYWSVTVDEINFKTSFKVNGEGESAELVPTFRENPAEPAITIAWNKNDAMKDQSKSMYLKFMAHIVADGIHHYKVHKQYLYAFDDTNNAYRLPISNLYDTCELCNGEYNSRATTALESLTKALHQFRNSSWNSDLWKSEGIVDNFIRFKPLANGFQTLPIKNQWTRSCAKIGTQLQKHAII
jgi:hypothetical protein